MYPLNKINMDVKNVIQRKIKGSSVSIKLLVIGFLLFLFLPATFMIQELVSERENRQDDAIHEVSSKWGQKQTIAGPILSIPYMTKGLEKYAYFSPERLDINAEVQTEVRSRGMYDVPLYSGDFKLSGNFTKPDWGALGVTENSVLWDKAFISLGIPDMKGVQERVKIDWQGESNFMNSGTKVKSLKSGTMVSINTSPEIHNYDFSLKLNLNGSTNLSFMPLGKTTNVRLKSDWINPSFMGAFLPTEHLIDEKGFEANWKVLDINRNFPQQWKETDGIYLESRMDGFGVDWYQPVDLYQQTDRSAKYAIVVIMLVFLVFFLSEVTSANRIHPLQYLMIGFALIIFYTLLLSFAEYVRFAYAYLISSTAIVSMITLYSKSVLKSWRLAMTNGTVLVFLYLFIYVLLQMDDFTLLIGSLGLFFILSAAMYSTRNINWYGVRE